MTFDAEDFIRRPLLNVLADGFMRIRHFGFLANRTKKHALPQKPKAVGTQSRFVRNPEPISPRPPAGTHRHRPFSLPPLPEGNDARHR